MKESYWMTIALSCLLLALASLLTPKSIWGLLFAFVGITVACFRAGYLLRKAKKILQTIDE
jgi:hypothetical protein